MTTESQMDWAESLLWRTAKFFADRATVLRQKRTLAALQKANATSEATLKYVENNFKQGYLQKTDVLSVQVRVNEVKNQLQYAKSNVQNASDYLAFLLQEDMTGKVYQPAARKLIAR